MNNEIPRIVRQLPGGDTAMYSWFQAMHTRVDILLKHTGPAACDLMQRVINEMQGVISGLEQVGNSFSPSSEISRLNSLSPGERMQLSPTLYDIFDKCIYYHAVTGGLFDISVSSPQHTPDTLHQLRLYPNHSASRESATLRLNLSGFLKGYALDRLKEVLQRNGIEDALINMGNSSILSMGDVPFHIRNACLTTSGNSTGNPLHIIDPATGDYISGLRTLSVVTENGTDGEVASTSLFICPPAQRPALAQALHATTYTEK